MLEMDLLIKNGTLLTMDEELKIHGDGAVGVLGDTICYVGKDRPELCAAKVIDAMGGIIMPGLVNAHTHAAMTLFRGLADDLKLSSWLNDYIFPAESRMDEDFVHTGSLLACAEMILSGTTTFCDMYLFEESVARAAKSAGMRCVVGEVLYDFPSPNYGPVEKGLDYTRDLIERWADDPLVGTAVQPHAPFTCSPDLLRAAREISAEYRVPFIIHLAETMAEVAEVKKRYGKSPVAHLESLGVFNAHVIADHCVHLDEKDMDILAERRVGVVHCPESNMKLASGIAPVPALIERGLCVGLGTDGCASNNDLDMLSEMDTAAKLHKVKSLDPTVMDAVTVLKMATSKGAELLGLGGVCGMIKKGYKADIIVVDTSGPHMVPMYDPYSHLVYAAGAADVKCTVINGRVRMEDREIEGLDTGGLLEKARKIAEDVKLWVKKTH